MIKMPEEAELPFVLAERYSGSDKTYQKVLVWKVGEVWDRAKGRLEQIRISSSDYSHTCLKLIIAGKTMFKDLEIQREMITIPPPNELPREREKSSRKRC